MAIVGVVLSLVPTILVLLDRVGISLPFSYEVVIVIMLVITLISFFLVGFGECISRSWRIMSSGLQIGGLVGLICFLVTFVIGGAIVIMLPIVITGMTFFKNR